MTYSTPMPILNFLAFFFLWVNYCLDKYLLFNYYRRTDTFNESLAMSTLGLYKWPVFFHCIVSVAIFSSRQVFYDSNLELHDIGLTEKLSVQVKETLNIHTGEYIQRFEQAQNSTEVHGAFFQNDK